MSKAIVMIDIPTDYADEYKQWIIDGRLCYLEDGAWTFLKEVEYKVEPYREIISIEWLKNYEKEKGQEARLQEALSAWEKENGKQ